MAEKIITTKIVINGKESLDECVEKANQLVKLLEKPQQIAQKIVNLQRDAKEVSLDKFVDKFEQKLEEGMSRVEEMCPKEKQSERELYMKKKEEREKAYMKIFEVMQGITYLEWTKIRQAIDNDFNFEASRKKDVSEIRSPEILMQTYKELF